MSKATVTFEDDGDQVAVHVDFGPGGGQETSGAHQMAMSAVTNMQREYLTNYERTAQWLRACGKTNDDLAVQIGCHIEELCEFLEVLRTDKEGYGKLLERTRNDLDALNKGGHRAELVRVLKAQINRRRDAPSVYRGNAGNKRSPGGRVRLGFDTG
jgi:hypothetical protein